MTRHQTPLAKALWFFESHLFEPPGLDEAARLCGLSRFQLIRSFTFATGMTPMAYVRRRRLSEAARLMVAGTDNLLGIALATGYGSHEAMTRAFREQFAITPEAFRENPDLACLTFQEAISMPAPKSARLVPTRIEALKAFTVAGHNASYGFDTMAGISQQWVGFLPHIGDFPGQGGEGSYGVCHSMTDDGFDYLCGLALKPGADCPHGFTAVTVAAGRYAIFAHRGHISGIRESWAAIMDEWLPASGEEMADAPALEYYGPDFDGRSGHGQVEIWIPLKG
ncbi:MAG TPA: AraC family transcriptional regulator [Aestuariivirga sp.]|nr:AraC family transcriptional regulator [Aestuariivirga sp.]